jgi:hypothetical protein
MIGAEPRDGTVNMHGTAARVAQGSMIYRLEVWYHIAENTSLETHEMREQNALI